MAGKKVSKRAPKKTPKKAPKKASKRSARGSLTPPLRDELDQPPLVKFFLETEKTISHLTLELDGKVARCFWRGPGHQAQAAALIQVVSPMLRTNPAQALATIRASGDLDE